MIPIGRLKNNLEFNKNFGDVIEVMKLAAISQFNYFRSRYESPAVFTDIFEDILKIVTQRNSGHALLSPDANLPAAIVLVSSDEGFLGELNTLLVNKLVGIKNDNDEVMVVGQQGAHFLEEAGIKFSSFPSPGEKIDSPGRSLLVNHIFQRFLQKNIGKVCIVYPRFINITSQQVEMEILLPLYKPAAEGGVYGEEFLFEPSIDAVIEGWIKLFLGQRLYQIFWSSKLAELAARIMHLEGSVQEVMRINQHLKLEYFKYLHGFSDKSIREIFASRLLKR